MPAAAEIRAATAGAPDPAASAPAAAEVAHQALYDLWDQRRAAVARDDAELRAKIEAAMRDQRRRDGVSRSEDLAGALSSEGAELLALGRPDAARASFQFATDFDPDMPRAWSGLATAEWRSRRPAAAAAALSEALRAALRNPASRAHGRARLLWALVFGLPVAALVALLVVLLRVLPLIRHDAVERWSPGLGRSGARALAHLLPWLPLLMPRGALAAAAVCWAALAGPYLSRRERIAVGLLAAAALAGALSGPAVVEETRRDLDPERLQLVGAATGVVSPERQRALTEAISRHPEDAVLRLLYADQCRGLGHYQEALAAYRQARELNPRLRQASTNAGALYFSLGQYATASSEFRRAVETDPKHLLAYYNLYLSQERRFDFHAAEQTLAEARGVDAAGMTELLSRRERRQERLDALTDRIPAGLLPAHAEAGRGAAASDPRLTLAVGVGAAALLGLGLFRSPRRTRATSCVSCGRVACPRCTPDTPDPERCASCITIGARAASLPRPAREAKQQEIVVWHARRHRIGRCLSIAIPGAVRLWGGQPLGGALLLAGSALGAGAVVAGWLLPPLPLAAGFSGFDIVTGPAAALLVGTWLLGLRLPPRLRSVALGPAERIRS